LEYTDLALSDISDDETVTMEMFQSEGAKGFVEKIRRLEASLGHASPHSAADSRANRVSAKV
jgi:hypothetical protein